MADPSTVHAAAANGIANMIVTTQFLAQLYSVSASTIQRWSRDGEIPIYKTLPSGKRQYRIGDVLAARPNPSADGSIAVATKSSDAKQTGSQVTT